MLQIVLQQRETDHFREKPGMKVTHHTHHASGRISVSRHGSCPLLTRCHGYLACCRSPPQRAGAALDSACSEKAALWRAQRSLLDLSKWQQSREKKSWEVVRRKVGAQDEELLYISGMLLSFKSLKNTGEESTVLHKVCPFVFAGYTHPGIIFEPNVKSKG